MPYMVKTNRRLPLSNIFKTHKIFYVLHIFPKMISQKQVGHGVGRLHTWRLFF